MESNRPLIYQYKTPGGYYIYDVNKSAILSVNKEVYDFLLNNEKELKIEDIEFKNEGLHSIKKMIKKGFLSSNRVKKIEHPVTNYIADMLDNKLQTITLQVTQQCNLRCRYCAYSGSYMNRRHSDKVMDISLAKEGIDFLLDHSQNTKVLNIGFYGGEPLLEFELVEECLRYAKEQSEGKKITFNMTTNATLLTKEIVEKLQEYDVNLMISLDGPKEIHDKNRRFAYTNEGTFDTIVRNMKMVKENFPEYYKKIYFNTVVDPKSDFVCLNEFFSDSNLIDDTMVNTSFVSTDNLDSDKKRSEEFCNIKYQEKLEYEMFKMFLCKLGRIREECVSKLAVGNFETTKLFLHSKRGITNELSESEHHGGVCVPGVRKLFLNISGNLYPCEKCNETSRAMSIGDIKNGFDIEKVKNLLNVGKVTEEKCKDCWAFRLCNICAISVDDGEKLSLEKNLKKCVEAQSNAHSMLVEYTMLKEFGFNFDNVNNVISFKENENE